MARTWSRAAAQPAACLQLRKPLITDSKEPMGPVLRYLVEEGLVSREGGRWSQTGDEPLARHIPEGLRDLIGKRLSRLSAECNRVLSVAGGDRPGISPGPLRRGGGPGRG